LGFQRKTATGNKKITVSSEAEGLRPPDFWRAGAFLLVMNFDGN